MVCLAVIKFPCSEEEKLGEMSCKGHEIWLPDTNTAHDSHQDTDTHERNRV